MDKKLILSYGGSVALDVFKLKCEEKLSNSDKKRIRGKHESRHTDNETKDKMNNFNTVIKTGMLRVSDLRTEGRNYGQR